MAWLLHAGGFAGKLHDSGDYPTPSLIYGVIFPNGEATQWPVNVYIPTYSAAFLGYLTSTSKIGDASIQLTSSFGCGYWWPTGGAPFMITLDQGANQESLSVTGSDTSWNCSADVWTLSSSLAKKHPVNSVSFTSVAAASGGETVYTGTITGGLGNAFAGRIFTVTGLVTTNDGTYMATASTPTALTLVNPNGVKETHEGTGVTNDMYVWINAVQPPLALNDLASFASFLGQCSYGGTGYNTGPCLGFTNVPGDPNRIIDFSFSAGGMWSLTFLQGGCSKGRVNGVECPFLNNVAGTSGYTPWTGTNWTFDNPDGTAALAISFAIDAPEVYAKDSIQGRLWTLGGVFPTSLCGCTPSCDNSNPASFTRASLTCNTHPSSCYSTCQQTLSPQYISAVLGEHVPVEGWGCDGVGGKGSATGSCIDGVPTCELGADPDFCEADCLIGSQPNMSESSYPGGHGCTPEAVTHMLELEGGSVGHLPPEK
jgi:hypothetical protein